MLVCNNGLMVIVPEGLPEKYLSFTTTRFSGFSKENYSSFNLGYFTEDINVNKNIDKLSSSFGIQSPFLLKQIHSSIIIDPDKCTLFSEGDGIITDKYNLPTGIMTADCWNVQLFGKDVVANLHCGWRSLFLGIIDKCIDLFADRNEDILYAVVGPGICADCYEVSESLVESFSSITKGNFFYKNDNGRYFLSLRAIIMEKLSVLNNIKIYNLDYCSNCLSYLYSYRRDNKITGRMMSVAMIYDK